MKTFIIKIDINSIKKNSDAGMDTFAVLGRKTIGSDGSSSRHIQIVRSLIPIPDYSFEYLDCIVECSLCSEHFSYKELLDGDYECDEDTNICPKCKKSNCCVLTFETLDQKTGLIIPLRILNSN